MTDTLSAAFTAAAAGLDGVARSLLEARLHQLQVDLATDHRTGARPVRVPGAGAVGAGAHRVPTPADAPLTAAEEGELLGMTRVGRRVLADRSHVDPPPLDPQDRSLVASTSLGQSILARHDAARPSERYLGGIEGAQGGRDAAHTETEFGR